MPLGMGRAKMLDLKIFAIYWLSWAGGIRVSQTHVLLVLSVGARLTLNLSINKIWHVVSHPFNFQLLIVKFFFNFMHKKCLLSYLVRKKEWTMVSIGQFKTKRSKNVHIMQSPIYTCANNYLLIHMLKTVPIVNAASAKYYKLSFSQILFKNMEHLLPLETYSVNWLEKNIMAVCHLLSFWFLWK